MKILSIGNSFSEDAQAYLHDIAREDKYDLYTNNLYIGGCPLAIHYKNMLSKEPAYLLQVNGHNTYIKISLEEALCKNQWDVITVQQASHYSPYYDTYQPYLDGLLEKVRMYDPKVKIAVHQTWSYEEDSKRLTEELGYKHHEDMFSDVKASYQKAYDAIGADIMIPSGELFENLLSSDIKKVHRDTFHASYGLGRYAIGLLWYTVLTGNDITNNTFCNFDEEVTHEEVAIAKKCVKEVAKMYNKGR